MGAVRSIDSNSDEGSAWFIGALSDNRDLDDDKWLTDLLINDTTVQFRIDTGADVSDNREDIQWLDTVPSSEANESSLYKSRGKASLQTQIARRLCESLPLTYLVRKLQLK